MVRNIVIVGGGSAGWMTAASLSKHLDGVKITLLESPNVPIIGVGESTVPPIVEFMSSLGFEEKEWMPACNATYKSAICFRNFHGTDDNRIWFPFSRTWGAANRPANRHWLYKYFTDDAFNDRFSIYDYCTLVPEICRQGKTVRSLPGSSYAYHLDAVALGQFLRTFSEKNGVRLVSDTITEVIQNEDGTIRELVVENGEPVTADLFIDCSGFRSLLLGQTLKEPFEDYYDSLFNDKAIAIRFPFEDKEKEMVSYTLCTSLSSGWVWTIPLYNRLGTGYVYSSKYQSEDEAEKEFRDYLGKFLGEKRVSEAEARHLDIRVGKHHRTWVKNCVAIGLSAGFIEPLESTGLQIVQSQVHLLTETLKGRNDYNCADMAIYNKGITGLLDNIRDFIVCHYALTGREDTPYWKDVKYSTKLSDSLVEKLSFARASMPARGSEQIFDTGGTLAGFGFNDGWYYILTGMDHLPFKFEQHKQAKVGAYDKALEEGVAEAENVSRKLDMERQNIPRLPSHYQYLKQNIYSGND
ncbi:tryptophan halogenase family protein [Pseudomonadota bacterium]